METVNNIEFSIVLVTPELAKTWLETNIGNRKIKPRAIASYAKDMLAGDWSITNDAITFDNDGKLTNGQNRLHAVIKSNTSQMFAVLKGIKHNKNMDRPSIRSVSDNLRMFTDLPELFSRNVVIGMCNYILKILNKEEKTVTTVYNFMKQYENEITNFYNDVGFGVKVKNSKYLNASILSAFFVAYVNGVDAELLKCTRKVLQTGEYAYDGYSLDRFLPAVKLERALRDCWFKNHDERYSGFLKTMFCINSISENKYLKQKNREIDEIVYDITYDVKSLKECHEVRLANANK